MLPINPDRIANTIVCWQYHSDAKYKHFLFGEVKPSPEVVWNCTQILTEQTAAYIVVAKANCLGLHSVEFITSKICAAENTHVTGNSRKKKVKERVKTMLTVDRIIHLYFRK